MSVHGYVQETIRVGIRAAATIAAADEVHDCQLSDIQDLADVPDESLRSETPGSTTVVDGVQAAVVGAGQDGAVASVVQPTLEVSPRPV